MNDQARETKRITIRGEECAIGWPPRTPEDWETLDRYLDHQDDVIHKLRRAVVALEKKAHWGLPSAPVLKRKCPFRCEDRDGNPIDPVDPRDEGDDTDTGGSGAECSEEGQVCDDDICWGDCPDDSEN